MNKWFIYTIKHDSAKSYYNTKLHWVESLKHAKMKVRRKRLHSTCVHLYEVLEKAKLLYTNRKWLHGVGVGLTKKQQKGAFG